jgi:DNA-binding response OmpR family regulator
MSLTIAEFEMLAFLVARAGRIVSRDEMCRTVFGREASVSDRALDVHLSHLRGSWAPGDRSS